MSYKEFLGRQPDDVTPEEGHKRFEAYTKDFARSAAQSCYQRHRNDAWMRERYDPQEVRRLQDALVGRTVPALRSFVEQLKLVADSPGDWPSFSLDETPNMTTEDVGVDGEVNTDAVGEVSSGGEGGSGDCADDGDDADDADDADEGDAKPELQPPDTTTEGPIPPPPSTGESTRRPPLQKSAEDGVSAEQVLFVGALPRRLSCQEAREFFAAQAGFTEVHAPVDIDPRQLTRRMWVVFDSKESAATALRDLSGKPVASDSLSAERLQHDYEQALAVTKQLDHRAGIMSIKYEGDDDDGGDNHDDARQNPVLPMLSALHSGLTAEKKLDLLLWYLRDVHRHCYYTCSSLWWPWNTMRSPALHARENDETHASGAAANLAIGSDPGDGAASGTASGDGTGAAKEPAAEPGAAGKPSDVVSGPPKQRKANRRKSTRVDGVHELPQNWHTTLDKRVARLLESPATTSLALLAALLAESVLPT
jgi:hypothetical protein